MGARGAWRGDWDVDEGQKCGLWIFWQIWGRYNLTNCVKPNRGKTVDLGDVFRPFGGLTGAPWAHG